MGSGSWTADVYSIKTEDRTSKGIGAFDYSTKTMSAAKSDRKVHDQMNPFGVNRESRDNKEHPNSVAISILFDVTGSMSTVPEILQKKLAGLMALIVSKNYCIDPQIMFGAIGDATCDQFPLQVGQFESDNRMDDDLGKIILEGGGGGTRCESYDLAMYFMARHTSIDCFEKRGKKGYLFIVADEMCYPEVQKKYVESIIGDKLEANIPLAAIVKELCSKYEVFQIMPGGIGYSSDASHRKFWTDLLGERALYLEDPENICELIGSTIGLMESTVSIEEIETDIVAIGSGHGTARSITRSLAGVASSTNIVKAEKIGGSALAEMDAKDTIASL